MEAFVRYYRVSTKRQGRSGLGLLAQQAIIEHFATCKECETIGEFTETVSAKNIKDRPELQKAMQLAIEKKATLIVAKLDRLSRNTKDTLTILETLETAGANLQSCDIPQMDKFTVTIFSAIAERERDLNKIRTKAGLDQKRRRDPDWKPGTPANLTAESRKKAWTASHLKAANNENNKRAKGYIMALRQTGLSYGRIADKLNAEGFQTSQKKHFSAMTVKRLHDRK